MTPQSVFQAIGPYRLLENFMGEEMVSRLLAHAAENQARFAATKVGYIPTEDQQTRQSHVLRDFGPLLDDLQHRFVALLPEAATVLGMPAFKLAQMELELVAHGDGAFFKTHIDTLTAIPDAQTDRVLTAVYYFHRLPKAFGGGEIRLHSIAPGGQSVDIVPPCDSLLLFPAWMPHEVCRVSCPSHEFLDSRFAINCWYRRARSGL